MWFAGESRTDLSSMTSELSRRSMAGGPPVVASELCFSRIYCPTYIRPVRVQAIAVQPPSDQSNATTAEPIEPPMKSW